MNWYKVVKPIEFLPNYKVGSRIPLYRGNRNQLIHHVWVMITEIPEECVELEVAP